MTIRVRDQLSELDPQRIAAAITRAVIKPNLDDSPQRQERAGTHWLNWSETVANPKLGAQLD